MIRRVVPALLVGAAVAVVAVVYANRSYTGYVTRVVLADAGGLQQGSNVTVNGVTVGQVASLYINRRDQAVAVAHLNRSAAPLGTGAQATVQIDGFFGERELMLTRGAYHSAPQPSGYTIPVQESGVSVRLDDVLDALNPDAQGALKVFLDEQGTALVGRSGELGTTLAELPQTLPGLTSLLSQLSANQRALGDAVDRSDRIVTEVAPQRAELGAFVNSANGALGALASRRAQLGATVQQAPSTLAQARATLGTLQGAAIPLAPAADGLRATAPSLTSALDQIPSFARAAVPTLNEVATVSPRLQQLADTGTPVVRALEPLTNQLQSYTGRALVPVTHLLADQGGAANLFGEMEGWARSTQGYDASSHIFRFGATVSPASFKQLLSMVGLPGLPALHRQRSAATAPLASVGAGGAAGSAGAAAPGAVNRVTSTLSGVASGALGAVNKTTGAVTGALNQVRSGDGTAPGSTSNSELSRLLGYLLGR